MPPTVSYRSQTLKQAKKAYRKSSATVRLSESELAVIERRAELQERADRIKEREARRKANIKRRDEKVQREREARQRMGIESPVKGGIHVGPSQLHLGEFMHLGVKRKREEPHCENIKHECTVAISWKECQAPAITPQPSRKPPQVITTNVTMQQRNDAKLEELTTQGQSRCTENIISMEPRPSPPSQVSPTALAQRKRLARTGDSKLDHKEPTKCETAPMGPPPLPGRLQPKPSATTAQPKPPRTALTYKLPDPVDDCWDDFFVSNTQIVRELSPPALKTIPPTLHAISTPSKPPIALPISPKDDTTNLLAFLSTQDLDVSDILTQALPQAPLPRPSPPRSSPPQQSSPENIDLLAQILNQDLDYLDYPNELELTQTPQIPHPQTPSSDFTDDLTVSDLENFALEIETSLQFPCESHKSQQYQEAAQLAAEAYDIGFEFSTQDLRELAS